MSLKENCKHMAIKVTILTLLAFCICIRAAPGQEGDELQQNHVTSPLISRPEFEHVGDMTIFHGQYDEDEVEGGRYERNVVADSRGKWPNGVIPYEISSVFSSNHRQVILDAMRHWEDHTCIRFRPKQANDIYSVYIMRDAGCYSFVGRLPSFYQPQGISLGTNCVFSSVVIHELGHAIGFYHEHTRPDRDNFIDVLYDNVANGFEDQFEKLRPGESDTLGLGYDLFSIMHYSRRIFSKDGSDTIRPKDPSIVSFGNSRELTDLDIAKANRFYDCAPPTTPPPPPPPCGGVLTAASGSFQTPNWPETYPNNVNCEWRIELPDTNKLVEIRCEEDPFSIAGTFPECTKDQLTFYDGHSKQADSFGPYCHFTSPDTLKMSSHLAMAVFLAGPAHSPSRKGFKCTFESVDPPTTAPPTTPPPPPCGGVLTTASGSFQTPNWPETYPNNVNCEWRIELPDTSKLVEIRCEEDPFSIAGTFPECTKDQLTFYDGHSKQADSFGPYCHFTSPDTLKMSSHLAMAVFLAGPAHSPSRKGFKCTFESVAAPTTAPPTTSPSPTTPPPTTTSPPPTTPPPLLCGGVLTTDSGSFQTPNWPETYPNNLDCEWRIELPDTSRVVEIRCEDKPFGIAGSLPACDKDHLTFYDGHSKQVDSFGPYCYFTNPETVTMSSHLAMAVFHAGPSHSPSRRGFRCTYQSAAILTTTSPSSPTTSSTPSSPPITTQRPTTPSTSSTPSAPPTTTQRPTTPSTSSTPSAPPTTTQRPTTPSSPPTPPEDCPLKTVPSTVEGTYNCNAFILYNNYFGLPGFPQLIDSSTPLDCDWTLIAVNGGRLRITYFDIPSSTDCSAQSLTIYEGLTDTGNQIDKLCGDICEEKIIPLNTVFTHIKFHMESSGAYRGFQAIVEQV